jgi:hypothetical protein
MVELDLGNSYRANQSPQRAYRILPAVFSKRVEAEYDV